MSNEIGNYLYNKKTGHTIGINKNAKETIDTVAKENPDALNNSTICNKNGTEWIILGTENTANVEYATIAELSFDTIINLFLDGNLVVSELEIGLMAKGVENFKSDKTNDDEVVTFTKDGKHYTLFCSTEAAVSQVDTKTDTRTRESRMAVTDANMSTQKWVEAQQRHDNSIYQGYSKYHQQKNQAINGERSIYGIIPTFDIANDYDALSAIRNDYKDVIEKYGINLYTCNTYLYLFLELYPQLANDPNMPLNDDGSKLSWEDLHNMHMPGIEFKLNTNQKMYINANFEKFGWYFPEMDNEWGYQTASSAKFNAWALKYSAPSAEEWYISLVDSFKYLLGNTASYSDGYDIPKLSSDGEFAVFNPKDFLTSPNNSTDLAKMLGIQEGDDEANISQKIQTFCFNIGSPDGFSIYVEDYYNAVAKYTGDGINCTAARNTYPLILEKCQELYKLAEDTIKFDAKIDQNCNKLRNFQYELYHNTAATQVLDTAIYTAIDADPVPAGFDESHSKKFSIDDLNKNIPMSDLLEYTVRLLVKECCYKTSDGQYIFKPEYADIDLKTLCRDFSDYEGTKAELIKRNIANGMTQNLDTIPWKNNDKFDFKYFLYNSNLRGDENLLFDSNEYKQRFVSLINGNKISFEDLAFIGDGRIQIHSINNFNTICIDNIDIDVPFEVLNKWLDFVAENSPVLQTHPLPSGVTSTTPTSSSSNTNNVDNASSTDNNTQPNYDKVTLSDKYTSEELNAKKQEYLDKIVATFNGYQNTNGAGYPGGVVRSVDVVDNIVYFGENFKNNLKIYLKSNAKELIENITRYENDPTMAGYGMPFDEGLLKMFGLSDNIGKKGAQDLIDIAESPEKLDEVIANLLKNIGSTDGKTVTLEQYYDALMKYDVNTSLGIRRETSLPVFSEEQIKDQLRMEHLAKELQEKSPAVYDYIGGYINSPEPLRNSYGLGQFYGYINMPDYQNGAVEGQYSFYYRPFLDILNYAAGVNTERIGGGVINTEMLNGYNDKLMNSLFDKIQTRMNYQSDGQYLDITVMMNYLLGDNEEGRNYFIEYISIQEAKSLHYADVYNNLTSEKYKDVKTDKSIPVETYSKDTDRIGYLAVEKSPELQGIQNFCGEILGPIYLKYYAQGTPYTDYWGEKWLDESAKAACAKEIEEACMKIAKKFPNEITSLTYDGVRVTFTTIYDKFDNDPNEISHTASIIVPGTVNAPLKTYILDRRSEPTIPEPVIYVKPKVVQNNIPKALPVDGDNIIIQTPFPGVCVSKISEGKYAKYIWDPKDQKYYKEVVYSLNEIVDLLDGKLGAQKFGLDRLSRDLFCMLMGYNQTDVSNIFEKDGEFFVFDEKQYDYTTKTYINYDELWLRKAVVSDLAINRDTTAAKSAPRTSTLIDDEDDYMSAREKLESACTEYCDKLIDELPKAYKNGQNYEGVFDFSIYKYSKETEAALINTINTAYQTLDEYLENEKNPTLDGFKTRLSQSLQVLISNVLKNELLIDDDTDVEYDDELDEDMDIDDIDGMLTEEDYEYDDDLDDDNEIDNIDGKLTSADYTIGDDDDDDYNVDDVEETEEVIAEEEPDYGDDLDDDDDDYMPEILYTAQIATKTMKRAAQRNGLISTGKKGVYMKNGKRYIWDPQTGQFRRYNKTTGAKFIRALTQAYQYGYNFTEEYPWICEKDGIYYVFDEKKGVFYPKE